MCHQCHPIGYGFERLDSKIGHMYRISSDNNCGRLFFFFFCEKMARGVGGLLFVGGYYFKYFPQSGAGAINRGTGIIRGNAPYVYVVNRLKWTSEINRCHRY